MPSGGDQMDIEMIEDKSKKDKLLQLPVARIKTIMKSSPDLGNVSNEGCFAIAKATELFVYYLAKQAYSEVKDKEKLDYKALSTVVRKDESLEFLEGKRSGRREIVPKKIKVSEYWKMIGYNPNEENENKANKVKIVEDDDDDDDDDVIVTAVKKSPSKPPTTPLTLPTTPLTSPTTSLKSPRSDTKSSSNTIVID